MPKPGKTAEARAAEARQLEGQLREVGLPDEYIQPVLERLADFRDTGQGFSGTVRMPGTPVVLVCLLSNQAHITSTIKITRR